MAITRDPVNFYVRSYREDWGTYDLVGLTNIFYVNGTSTIAGLVEDWVDEQANYDLTTGCASGYNCNNYTQIVHENAT